MSGSLNGAQCDRVCLTAPALPLVSGNLGDDITHSLQTERPARSSAEVAERDDEENTVLEETSSVVELCLVESPSLVYGEGSPSVPNVGEADSKKRKLSSSMKLTRIKWIKVATRSGGRKRDGYGELKVKS